MNRIVPGLIWVILWIISWLPGFIMRYLSYLIKIVVFQFFRYRSEVIKTNLNHSFPEITQLERNTIAHKFYLHFSELFLEMILITRFRPHKNVHRMRFSNPEIISRAFEQKQNIIVVTGHYGNWEWNPAAFLAFGYRMLAVYKPQSSKIANQLMKDIRQKPGIILVPMKDTFRIISRELREKKSPFVVLLVADQIPARGDIRFWTPFLNQETAFFTGAEKLAKRFGLPVLYVEHAKLKFGSYEVTATPIYDGVSATEEGEITRTFAGMLEASIRKNPYLWLWSHRRWKYRREELTLRP